MKLFILFMASSTYIFLSLYYYTIYLLEQFDSASDDLNNATCTPIIKCVYKTKISFFISLKLIRLSTFISSCGQY